MVGYIFGKSFLSNINSIVEEVGVFKKTIEIKL